jgi:hypothetical protein
MDRHTLWAFLTVFVLLASGCSYPLRTEPAANEPLDPRPVEQVPSAHLTDAVRLRSSSVCWGSVRAWSRGARSST